MFNVAKLVAIADTSRGLHQRAVITTTKQGRTFNGDAANFGKLISLYFQYLGVNFVYHSDMDAIQFIDSETLLVLFDDGTYDDVTGNTPDRIITTINQLMDAYKN